MELLRLSEAEVAELGGPAAAAMRLRELVPAGDSVAAEVAEILRSVRAGGDQALAELTRRYDTGGADPRPLLVEPEALDEAIRWTAPSSCPRASSFGSARSPWGPPPCTCQAAAPPTPARL